MSKYKYPITVIVATYNPEWKKLRSTLLSIVTQKNIDFEIIITDDGSNDDYFDKAREFFIKNEISKYRFIKNQINIGTVKNFYNAIKCAGGEYVYGISPGDMFYEETTLEKLYFFACIKNTTANAIIPKINIMV